MARYSFLTTDGPDKDKTFILKPGVTYIGRRDTPAEDEPENSHRWVLTDPAVSRTHARIDWDGEGDPVLVHLSSTNATLLDGRIVTGVSEQEGPVLQDGQKIRMGQTGFEIVRELEQSRWCLQENGTDKPLPDEEEVEVDGVTFRCSGSTVQASLSDETVEAYLLRSIDGQFWTTSLRKNSLVRLRESDVVRTEYHKMLVCDREAVPEPAWADLESTVT